MKPGRWLYLRGANMLIASGFRLAVLSAFAAATIALTVLPPIPAKADDQASPPAAAAATSPKPIILKNPPSASSEVVPAGSQVPASKFTSGDGNGVSGATQSVGTPGTKTIGGSGEQVGLVTKPVGKIAKKVAAIARKLFPDTQFKLAADSFPSFCADWQHKLHERESNNRNQLTWKELNGWKSAIYTGYSNIVSCECKKSSHGIPIGKLSYSEFTYYLTGHDVDEASHATPKQTSITITTEIFRWDKTHWAY
jgi:hypothetical protein